VKLYVGGRPTFFYVFTFFSDFKKHDFLRFFELLHTFSRTLLTGWLGCAEWLACWTQAQKGPGSNRSRDAVG